MASYTGYFLNHPAQLFQVQVPVLLRWRTYADHRDVCVLQGGGNIRRGGKTPGGRALLNQLLQPRLIERRVATVHRGYFMLVLIHPDDAKATVCQTCRCNTADIPEAQNRDLGVCTQLRYAHVLSHSMTRTCLTVLAKGSTDVSVDT